MKKYVEKLEKLTNCTNIKITEPLSYKHSKVTCTCPLHGNWTIKLVQALRSTGCPICARQLINKKRNENAKKTFIEKAIKKHGNKYNYSKVIYKTGKTPVTIICSVHGDFKQRPSDHLRGYGCKQCGIVNGHKKKNLSFKEFKEKANIIHKNNYIYNSNTYINSTTKTVIICPIHGAFEQFPYSHLRGHGCSACATYGFNNKKPAILYYLKINGGQVYKIGITNRTISERFQDSELKIIEVIFTKFFKKGKDAYTTEQEILKKYKEFQYTGPAILKIGNTELFTENILKDTNELQRL